MNARLTAAVLAVQPSAKQEPLRVQHPALPPRTIRSPFSRHHCWAFRVGADPLDGSPLMDYGCISDHGDIYYPYRASDFQKMLSVEDTSGWSSTEYQDAAQLYIHLQRVTNQDAGWVVLQSAAEFMAIDFNMQPEQAQARGLVSQKIQPIRHRDQTVELFTWTVIGGALQQWAISFRPPEVSVEVTSMGNFGGGGYD